MMCYLNVIILFVINFTIIAFIIRVLGLVAVMIIKQYFSVGIINMLCFNSNLN